MSETSGFPQYAGATGQMRTLAVRITDDLRAQLDVIAQLNDRSVTEEIRLSLEDWIERRVASAVNCRGRWPYAARPCAAMLVLFVSGPAKVAGSTAGQPIVTSAR